jgi:hypothetical protein
MKAVHSIPPVEAVVTIQAALALNLAEAGVQLFQLGSVILNAPLSADVLADAGVLADHVNRALGAFELGRERGGKSR